MHTKALSSALLLLELVAVATAAPPPQVEKRSFKVERVRNDAYTGRNGPQALAKVYRKYGMPLPPGLVNALEAQDKQEPVTVRATKRRAGKWHNPNEKGAQGSSGKHVGATASAFSIEGGAGEENGEDTNAGDDTGDDAGDEAGDDTADDGESAIDPLAKAGEGNQTGKVVNNPEKNDVEYLSQIKIGGQSVTLDFDTGSSDLWVFNTQLSAQQTQGRAIYDPAKSKTFKVLQGAQFTVRYGDGSGASGNVGTDVVDVGGAVAPQQAVELATEVTDTFVRDINNGGLMGLAFSSINGVRPQKQKTFFENVMPSLQEPLFTADLRAGAAGAYEFGRVDTSKFQGDLAWIPIDSSKGFWQFSSEFFAVDGGQAQKAAQGGQAIADTGTTLLLADPTIVDGYYAQVQGAQNSQQMGGFVVPCNAQLPDLDLDIGGVYMARIKGSDINFAPVGNGGKFSSPFERGNLNRAWCLASPDR